MVPVYPYLINITVIDCNVIVTRLQIHKQETGYGSWNMGVTQHPGTKNSSTSSVTYFLYEKTLQTKMILNAVHEIY